MQFAACIWLGTAISVLGPECKCDRHLLTFQHLLMPSRPDGNNSQTEQQPARQESRQAGRQTNRDTEGWHLILCAVAAYYNT
jgi:hypothetical protein